MLRKKRPTGIGKINKINFRNEIRYVRLMDALMYENRRICPTEQRLTYKVGIDDMVLTSPIAGNQFVFDYTNALPLTKGDDPYSYLTLNKFMVNLDILLIKHDFDDDIMDTGYSLVVRSKNNHETNRRILNDISLDQYNILRKLSRLSSETNFTITGKNFRFLSGLEDELHISHHTLLREKCFRGYRRSTYYDRDNDFTDYTKYLNLMVSNLIW